MFISSDDEVESVIEAVEGKIGLDVADEQKRFFAIKLLREEMIR